MKKVVCSLLIMFILFSEFTACLGATNEVTLSNDVDVNEKKSIEEKVDNKKVVENETEIVSNEIKDEEKIGNTIDDGENKPDSNNDKDSLEIDKSKAENITELEDNNDEKVIDEEKNNENSYKTEDNEVQGDENTSVVVQSIQVQNVDESEKRLVELDGVWRMMVNGKIVYDYTGVGRNDNGMWYMENGNISYKYNGTWFEGEDAYIIENNRVQIIVKKDTTRLMEINSNWRMVVNGTIIYNYTGLGQNGNGIWYLENGYISYTYTGIYTDESGITYFIENNRLVGTKLVEIKGIWRMIVDGKIVYDYTGVGRNGNGMWYLENGKISYRYNGTWYGGEDAYIIENNRVQMIVKKDTTRLMEINGNWRMIVDGKIVYDYTGVGQNGNGMWYMENGQITYRYNGVCHEDEKTYIIKNSRVQNLIDKDTTRLIEIDGVWRMFVDGKIVYDYTGVGQNGNGMWYLENGNISYRYKGTWYDRDDAYIIENNRVQMIVKKDTTRLMEINGNWRMVVNGKIVYDYTGVGQNGNGMWYMENGQITYRYNGVYHQGEKTYIIKNSRVQNLIDKDTTRLIEIDGVWRMFVDGKIVYDYTGVGQNGNGMWYLENGIISYSYNGTWYDGDDAYIIENNRVQMVVKKDTTRLMEINGNWRMVVNGKIVYDYTGVGQNGNGMWFLENGIISYNYTGIYSDETGTYVIKNNRLVGTKLMEIDGIWRMVVNGKIVYDYTGVGQNDNGRWYLENGNISYKYMGTWFDGDNAYIIEGSRVQIIVKKDTTGLFEINREWRMIKNGVVDYNYTGVGSKNDERWYLENGKITYTYEGEYEDEDGIVYKIEGSRLSGIINRPGYSANMVIEQPRKLNKYISDSLSISGWALSTEKDDKILIYVDGKLIGEASREIRDDIFEKYNNNEYGGIDCTPMPGFYFDLSTMRISIGRHVICVMNVSSDGKVIIQSREVVIDINALSKSYGIDVSHYQGEIDWDAVKNSGVTFAILKIGEYWSNSKKVIFDQFFERNYQACKRLGIAIGGYFYSYAFNSSEANEEADICLSLIKNKKFELPIFLDVEDKLIKNAVANGVASVESLTSAAVTFCERMSSAGYQGGVYASRDFFYNYFNIPTLERFAIWLAHYTSVQTDYTGKYDFWQYTSKGSVPGINGNVDLNWFFNKR